MSKDETFLITKQESRGAHFFIQNITGKKLFVRKKSQAQTFSALQKTWGRDILDNWAVIFIRSNFLDSGNYQVDAGQILLKSGLSTLEFHNLKIADTIYYQIFILN